MNKVQIIAEIGQNWMGNFAFGLRLIHLAKENGADFAKFQLYDSKKLYGEYQKTEVSREIAEQFFKYGLDKGIEVFFSVFDLDRVRWCEEMGVKRYKIAYSQKDNRGLYEAIWKTGKYHNGWTSGRELYCIPHYPTKSEELKFESIIIKGYPTFEGFSDHTVGLTAAKVAISRGARVIEKHFAIDHETGVDAPWSMTPPELKELRTFADEAVQCL